MDTACTQGRTGAGIDHPHQPVLLVARCRMMPEALGELEEEGHPSMRNAGSFEGKRKR